MLKKFIFLVFSLMLVANLSGCFLFVAGVAGGAGTAAWLSGKLTQEFHAPFQRTVEATRLALKSLDLNVVKETQAESITQFKGDYTDGREMWIDVHRVDEYSTKVEVRVGGVNSDKEAASKILKRIQDNL
jgi:hypothetical protein